MSAAAQPPAERPKKPGVAEYVRASQSKATTRSYRQGISHFKKHGGRIPASPEMLAGYVAKFAGKLAVATLQHRLIAIHRAHVDKGIPSPAMDPLVKRTMQGIRRTFGTAQRRVRALEKDDLLRVLTLVEKQPPLRAARDKALLLVGFAGAFRRSELVALKVEDVSEYAEGIELLIRRSKTDQTGQGRTVFIPAARGDQCPVQALAAWLAAAGISDGPLFRRVTRYDSLLGDRGLTPQSVALIVKEAVAAVRGATAAADFSGHSLRAGYITSAAVVGLQPYQIREVSGHRSDVTLAKYIRPVAKRKVPSLL